MQRHTKVLAGLLALSLLGAACGDDDDDTATDDDAAAADIPDGPPITLGAQDFGEYVAETAVRETREEAGIDVEVVDVVGIYSDPKHVVEYSNGEVRQQFSICFRARYLGGQPTASEESAEVR